MLAGGCFCGFIRYEAGGVPFNQTACHCSICRRTSGAPLVAWFTVASADFRLLSGQPTSLRSSDHGTRTFCPRCGTPLTFGSSRSPEEVDVTTCSLDDPEGVPPQDQTRVSAKVAWVRLDEHLPAFAEGRSP